MERILGKETTKDELLYKLLSHGIPVYTWGTGESKTLSHLLKEINTEESVIMEGQNGELLRAIRGVGINVYFCNGSNILRLKEDRQEFGDGRVRRRVLSTSVGEKMTPGELPFGAAERALKEELDLSPEGLSDTYIVEDRDIIASTSFPGLQTKNTVYVFNCFVTPQQYNPNGYIERQSDKTSYFIWESLK